jgi:CxxC-x17-CxxC domain-containing protein
MEQAATRETLTCATPGAAFPFTSGERGFFARKGLSSAPRLCAPCRQARNRARTSPSPPVSAPPRPRFRSACGSCGVPTEVPFRPANGRPIYCRDCYALRQEQGSHG